MCFILRHARASSPSTSSISPIPVAALLHSTAGMAHCQPGIYRRRRPETTPLYRAVSENLELFYDTYDERFLTQHGPLTSRARRALGGFISCGQLWAGFARARCDSCGREMLVAFSCQLRGVCSSCQQKRAELLCGFLQEEVIEPVDHRQLVFVVPERFRGIFHNDRTMLRGLCRTATDATQAFYRAGLACEETSVGLVLTPQLFGDAVNPHVHLHGLCTDGAFDSSGAFHRLFVDAQGDIQTLTKLFEKGVLDLLVNNQRLSKSLRDEMLTWRHTGFSVDASVRVPKGDSATLGRLVRYMARPAVAFDRVEYDERTGMVTVRSAKKLRGERRVVAKYDVLTFLALLTLQVPPSGTHMVRYFGWYSTRSRAKRRKPTVLAKVLDHLGEPTELPRATGPPRWYDRLLAEQHVQANPHVYQEVDDDHAGHDADAAWSHGEWNNA